MSASAVHFYCFFGSGDAVPVHNAAFQTDRNLRYYTQQQVGEHGPALRSPCTSSRKLGSLPPCAACTRSFALCTAYPFSCQQLFLSKLCL